MPEIPIPQDCESAQLLRITPEDNLVPQVEADTTPERPEINRLEYPRGYFDAQVQFAQKWSEITGQDFASVLLEKTALYRRLYQQRPPKDDPQAWGDLLDGVVNGSDHEAITDRLYAAYSDQSESVFKQSADQQSFGYHYYPDRHTVKIHFTNPVRGERPFSEDNLPLRQAEFKQMLEDVRATHPDAETLMSATWLRSTGSYRRMSPPDIAEQESLMSPDMDFGGNSVWGQFIDSSGNVNQRVYDQFIAALEGAKTLDDLLSAFPYKTLKAEDPIAKYYDYYGLG